MEQFTLVRFKAAAETTAIIEAFLMDLGFHGIEETETETIACISEAAFDKASTDAIFEQFGLTYDIETVEQQNWNALWERSFEPVIVDDFVAIRASFHAPVSSVIHEIVITPKMSFGTGHHATTYLVMQEMRSVNFGEKSVIDFGTGTGVLAILAEKLGAKEVLAIDNDEWSMNNAQENIAANSCKHISLSKADSMPANQKADVVLANINLNVIVENITLIKESCRAGTLVILSGLMTENEAQIREVLTFNSFKVMNCVSKNNWIAIKACLI